ncbi:hypothetical protein ACS0PU_003422 [Formica fusca]
MDDEARTSHESREKESRGCTHSEVSAGLRIKTRGEFESGKVLNDFRRSCLASWFIRKSQFAQRAERTNEIDKEKKREREKERSNALVRAMRKGEQAERKREREALDYIGRKSPTKLRRCISPFVTPTPGRVQRLDVDVEGDQGCSRDVRDIASVRRNSRHLASRNALAPKFYRK